MPDLDNYLNGQCDELGLKMSHVNNYNVEPDSTTVIMDDDDEEDYYIVSVRDCNDSPKQRPSQSWQNREASSQQKKTKARNNVTNTVTPRRDARNQSKIISTLSSMGTFQKTPKKNEDMVSAILKDGSPNLIKNLGLQSKKSISSRNPVPSPVTKDCKQECTCRPKPNGFTNKPEEAIAIPDSDDEDSDDCVITENLGLDMDCRNEDDNRHITTFSALKNKTLSKQSTTASSTTSRSLDFSKSDQNDDEDDDLVITDQYKLPKERVVQVQEKPKPPIQHRIPSPPPEDRNLEPNISPVPPQPVVSSPPKPVQVHANVHRLPSVPSNPGIQPISGGTATVGEVLESYRTIPTSSFVAVPQVSNCIPAIRHLQHIQAMYDATLPGTMGYRTEAANTISVHQGTIPSSHVQPQQNVPNRMIEVFPLLNPNVLSQQQMISSVAAKSLLQILPDNTKGNDSEESEKSQQDLKKAMYSDMSPQERIAFLQQALEQEKEKINSSNTDNPKSKTKRGRKKKSCQNQKKTKGSGNTVEARKLRSELEVTKTRSGSMFTPFKSKTGKKGMMSNKKNSKSGNSKNIWRSEFARRSSVKAKKYLGANKTKTNLNTQNNKILQRVKIHQSDKTSTCKQKELSVRRKSLKGEDYELEIKKLQEMLDRSHPIEIKRNREEMVSKKRSRVLNDGSDNSYKPALKKKKYNYKASDVGKKKKCNTNVPMRKEGIASKFDEECRKKVITVKLDKQSKWKKMIKDCKVTLKQIEISADRKVITVKENAHVYKRVDLLYLLEGGDYFPYKNVTFKKHLLRVKEPDPMIKMEEKIKAYHEESEKSNEPNVKALQKYLESVAPVKKSRSVAKKRSSVPFGLCGNKPALETETIVLSDDEDDGAVYNAGALDASDSEEDETVQRRKWLDRLLHSESSRALRANRGPKSIRDKQEEEEEDVIDVDATASKSELTELSTIKKESISEKDMGNSILPELCHVKKEGFSLNEKQSQNETEDIMCTKTKGSGGIQVDGSCVKKEINTDEVMEKVFSETLKSVKVENCPDDVPASKDKTKQGTIKTEKEG